MRKAAPSFDAKTSAERIRSYADRINRLDAEISEMNSDKAEVFKDAKGQGFDLPALKTAIKKWRKMQDDPAAAIQAEEMADIYFLALQDGATSKTAPDRSGVAANGLSEASTRTRTMAAA